MIRNGSTGPPVAGDRLRAERPLVGGRSGGLYGPARIVARSQKGELLRFGEESYRLLFRPYPFFSDFLERPGQIRKGTGKGQIRTRKLPRIWQRCNRKKKGKGNGNFLPRLLTPHYVLAGRPTVWGGSVFSLKYSGRVFEDDLKIL